MSKEASLPFVDPVYGTRFLAVVGPITIESCGSARVLLEACSCGVCGLAAGNGHAFLLRNEIGRIFPGVLCESCVALNAAGDNESLWQRLALATADPISAA